MKRAIAAGLALAMTLAACFFWYSDTRQIYVLFLIACLFAIGEDIRRRWPAWFTTRALPEAARGQS